ncbi:MAG: UDP-glucose 4-epimerase GalE [Hyphomicrobiales bacterium]|nr:UDP-glucose 4-epimerase GalE [Hyphomicrobiales bacterium]MCP4998461.1 UDP-glucose 4-epimerase GalE [Hyphomicrobiales bacterium]
MTVLVTGGAGYIGSHMVWRLLDAGETVVVVDRLSTGFDWAVPTEANLVVCDIGDQQQIEALLREHTINAVFHFAGSIVVPESVTDPLGYYLNNTVNSRSLMEACVNAGVSHFVFSSTAAVYGTPDAMELVSEEAALRPESPYGTSKLMTEMMLQDVAAAHPMNYACLRYFNVSGADPAGRTGQSTRDATHLIKVATQAALGKRPYLQVYGTDYPTPDGTCIRDYIHVTDLIEAHYLALRHLRETGENLVVNCGYGHGQSVLEVIETVKRVSGSDFEVRTAERRAGDTVTIVANSDRIREQLEWAPRFDDLDNIVTHALQWEEALKRRNS